MADLIFSRDGVLRMRFSAYDRVSKKRLGRLVPLRAWEAGVDEHAFLKSLHSAISFEDGLSVGEMMENLAPWAEMMTGVACMDFPAFLEEARRGGKRVEDIDRIELRYHAAIEAVPRFERIKPEERDPDKRDFRSVLGLGRPMRTDRVVIEERWDYSAVLTEEGRAQYEGSDSVSLSFTPVSEYAHLPLIINRRGVLHDQAPIGADYLGTRLPLLNPAHPLTEEVERSRLGTLRLPIDAPEPTLFDTLVRGLLWEMGFDYSPAQRDASGEAVMRSVEALKGGEVEDEPEDDNAEFMADSLRLRRAQEAADKLGLAVIDPKALDEEDED